MRGQIFVAAALLLSGCSQNIDALPDAYRGEWDLNRTLCADEDGVSRLHIDVRRLGYYDDSAVFAGPVRRDKDRVSAYFDLHGVDDQMDGTGPRKGVPVVLELGGSGNRLTVTIDGESEDYLRCPRAAGQA